MVPPQAPAGELRRMLVLSNFGDMLATEDHENVLSSGLEQAKHLLRGLLVPQEFHRGLEDFIYHDVRRSAHYCVFLHEAVLCLGLHYHSRLTTATIERVTRSFYSEIQQFISIMTASSVMPSLMGMMVTVSILGEDKKGERLIGTEQPGVLIINILDM